MNNMAMCRSDEFVQELRDLLEKYGAQLFVSNPVPASIITVNFYNNEIANIHLGQSFDSKSPEDDWDEHL